MLCKTLQGGRYHRRKEKQEYAGLMYWILLFTFPFSYLPHLIKKSLFPSSKWILTHTQTHTHSHGPYGLITVLELNDLGKTLFQ